MLMTDIVNIKRQKVGEVELDASVFGKDVNQALMHEVVRWQLASRRQGTHMTKTKGMVSGGGKKPFKQKGTGSARQGSSRSILMPGGGTAFGPVPRDYSYALPKKVRKSAISSALSYLYQNKRITVLDALVCSGKTKEFSEILYGLGLEKAVVIDESVQELSRRASANLRYFKYLGVEGLNVFDLLKYDRVVILKNALPGIVNRCKVSTREK